MVHSLNKNETLLCVHTDTQGLDIVLADENSGIVDFWIKEHLYEVVECAL